MNISEYLSQYKMLKSWLQDNRDTLEDLKSLITDPRTPDLQDDPVQVSPSGEAPYAKELIHIEQLEETIRLEEMLLYRLKYEMLDLFACLTPSDRKLMTERYIICSKWEHIFLSMHACRASVFSWHKRILAQLSLPENFLNVEEELARHKKAS